MASVPRSTLAAAVLGNVLEWYDFAIYGFFAPHIARVFFPHVSHEVAIVRAFAVFAAGYVARPIGGFLFGAVADRLGRVIALRASVILMGLATLGIGLLPDRTALGGTAILLLVLGRIVQGVSAAGEVAVSMVLLTETAGPRQRGFRGSWGLSGAFAGILLASLVGTLLVRFLSQQELEQWGWRTPFLMAPLLSIVALYLRRRHHAHQRPLENGLKVGTLFRTQWRSILHVAGLNVGHGVTLYLVFVFITTWPEPFANARALSLNTASMAVIALLIPFAAAHSDRVGRKPVLIASMSGIVVLAYPLLWLMSRAEPHALLVGKLGFAVLLAPGIATLPATMVEMVDPHARVSVIGIGYNLSFAVFGGTAPLAAIYLLERSPANLSVAYYLMATAAIALGFILALRETAFRPLSKMQ